MKLARKFDAYGLPACRIDPHPDVRRVLTPKTEGGPDTQKNEGDKRGPKTMKDLHAATTSRRKTARVSMWWVCGKRSTGKSGPSSR